MYFLLKMGIFQCHLSFQGCSGNFREMIQAVPDPWDGLWEKEKLYGWYFFLVSKRYGIFSPKKSKKIILKSLVPSMEASLFGCSPRPGIPVTQRSWCVFGNRANPSLSIFTCHACMLGGVFLHPKFVSMKFRKIPPKQSARFYPNPPFLQKILQNFPKESPIQSTPPLVTQKNNSRCLCRGVDPSK